MPRRCAQTFGGKVKRKVRENLTKMEFQVRKSKRVRKKEKFDRAERVIVTITYKKTEGLIEIIKSEDRNSAFSV